MTSPLANNNWSEQYQSHVIASSQFAIKTTYHWHCASVSHSHSNPRGKYKKLALQLAPPCGARKAELVDWLSAVLGNNFCTVQTNNSKSVEMCQLINLDMDVDVDNKPPCNRATSSLAANTPKNIVKLHRAKL
jgi:hypothetical protein